MEVIIKFNQGDLEGSGPFKITYSGYVTGEIHNTPNGTPNDPPLVASVPKWQLLNGFTFSAPDAITRIRVSELSPCNNFVDIDILSEPSDVIEATDPGYNIKIIGSAVSVGFYTMERYDIYNYRITGAFVNGNAQFDIDGGIYGETSFPTGSVVDDVSLQIPVVAGNYKVTLDVSTGEYSFIVV